MISHHKVIDDVIKKLKEQKITLSDINKFKEFINTHKTLDSAVKKADIIAILTEWEVFKEINFNTAKKDYVLIDGRYMMN